MNSNRLTANETDIVMKSCSEYKSQRYAKNCRIANYQNRISYSPWFVLAGDNRMDGFARNAKIYKLPQFLLISIQEATRVSETAVLMAQIPPNLSATAML